MLLHHGGAGEATSELVLGFLPPALVTQLTDEEGRWCAKGSAVEELCDRLRRVTDVKLLLTHVESLFKMIAALLKDTQFKVIMSLLRALEVRYPRPGWSTAAGRWRGGVLRALAVCRVCAARH
jgi:hypothetical protein